MLGTERDGENDLRGEVGFVAVTQQHTERKERHREICSALYNRIMYVRVNLPAWP